jgi:signal transduction histidine kinase
VSQINGGVRTYGFELVVVLLMVTGMLEVQLRRASPDAPHTPLWFQLSAIAVLVLPLYARRRNTFAAATTYWLLAVGLSFIDGRLVPFVASVFVLGMAASYLLGNLRDAVQVRIGLAVVLTGAAVVVYNLPDHSASQLLFIPLPFGMCWLAGRTLRERAEQAEAAEVRATRAEWERDAAARVAVAEERARIAREMHDIVAHSVSVMVLQVGAVRHRLPDGLEDDREALRRVEQAGRSALTQMRRLLGAMRRDGDGLDLAPQPGLDGLDSLVDDVSRAGLAVRLNVDGERFELPRGIDLSAYRIVQEGLTNALKHAHASHADVTVRFRRDELEVEVVDDGAGSAAGSDGLGHGLVGIRERVKIYGGEMSAGAAATGGFALTARLPVDPGRP